MLFASNVVTLLSVSLVEFVLQHLTLWNLVNKQLVCLHRLLEATAGRAGFGWWPYAVLPEARRPPFSGETWGTKTSSWSQPTVKRVTVCHPLSCRVYRISMDFLWKFASGVKRFWCKRVWCRRFEKLCALLHFETSCGGYRRSFCELNFRARV